MEMHRLRVFCRVVELKSFTKAGESLKLSQPTVSEHIKGLEESLGEKLVDRLGREVLPTPAGRILYQYARNIVQMNDEAAQALEQFKGNLSGRLVLGASTIPGTYMLPRLIGPFKAMHPSIQITLKISDTTEIADQVLEGVVEAGIVGSSLNDRRLLSEEIFSDELILVVPTEHPWAGQESIRADSLIGEPFIMREIGSGTRMAMNRILEEHGFDMSKLTIISEMGSTEAVRQGIKARIGVSILSREAVVEDLQFGTLVHVPIKGLQFTRLLYLVQRKNRQMSPVCAAFIEYIRM
jgi:DNA-binding transcriptional LysR family regulator